GVAAEYGGVGVDGDVGVDVGVAFSALDRVAAAVHLEGFRAEGDALVGFYVMADAGGFADDDAGAVVDEEVGADLGAGVDVGAGAFVGILGEHPGQQRDLEVVEEMGDALQRDHQHAGVGEDDFLDAARGRVAAVGGLHVGLHDGAQ